MFAFPSTVQAFKNKISTSHVAGALTISSSRDIKLTLLLSYSLTLLLSYSLTLLLSYSLTLLLSYSLTLLLSYSLTLFSLLITPNPSFPKIDNPETHVSTRPISPKINTQILRVDTYGVPPFVYSKIHNRTVNDLRALVSKRTSSQSRVRLSARRIHAFQTTSATKHVARTLSISLPRDINPSSNTPHPSPSHPNSCFPKTIC
jgi:hypothetical protein